MIKVAIAGNIASGKSTVQEFLIKKGYKVLDTDSVAKFVRENFKNDIIALFEGYDILVDGEISIKKLSDIVFCDDDLNKKLTNFMHPIIRKEIFKFFEMNKNEKIIFVGIPLLFEAGMESDYDKIIFVYADDEIRLKRLIIRSGLSFEDAKLRLGSQQKQNNKIKKSDYIINNNGSKNELYKQIDEILVNLLQVQKL